MSGFDEKEVREEDEEGFSARGFVFDGVNDMLNGSGGWEFGLGVGGSIVIPSYMKSEESSFESGSGWTP